MNTEKFVKIFDEITPTEEKKALMLENILKSKRKKSPYSVYYKYATGIASVFAIAVILTSYPEIKEYMFINPEKVPETVVVQEKTQPEKEVVHGEEQGEKEVTTTENVYEVVLSERKTSNVVPEHKNAPQKSMSEEAVVIQTEDKKDTPLPEKASVQSVSENESYITNQEVVEIAEEMAQNIAPATQNPDGAIMMLSEEENTGRMAIPVVSEISYEDLESYFQYVPETFKSEENFVGGMKQEETVFATFMREDVTIDMKVQSTESFEGNYTNINEIADKQTVTLNGGDVAVTYSVYGENANCVELVNQTEYFGE